MKRWDLCTAMRAHDDRVGLDVWSPTFVRGPLRLARVAFSV